MGRPRKYATHAERQAAYRARSTAERTWIVVNRYSLELLEARLERLHSAVQGAADRGDPLARLLAAGSADTCVDKITAWFAGHAGVEGRRVSSLE